jgi:hypothetical protein
MDVPEQLDFVLRAWRSTVLCVLWSGLRSCCRRRGRRRSSGKRYLRWLDQSHVVALQYEGAVGEAARSADQLRQREGVLLSLYRDSVSNPEEV